MQSACVDGRVVPLSEATISVTDEGLLRGDGVFEVMRLYDNVPFGRAAHLERMVVSARNLRLNLDVEAIARDIETPLAAARPGDALVRALATRGGRRIVLIEPLPAVPPALALGYVTYSPTRVLDGIKSLSYGANMLATRLARERGFDDALLVSPHGRILELPTSSFYWVTGGRVHTPPLDEHILDSITRRLVLEAADVDVTAATPADLESAEEAFIASSVYEVIPVGRVEERQFAPGPVTETVAQALRDKIAAEVSGLARAAAGGSLAP
jgi:branched-chain amino acid aminotransferase